MGYQDCGGWHAGSREGQSSGMNRAQRSVLSAFLSDWVSIGDSSHPAPCSVVKTQGPLQPAGDLWNNATEEECGQRWLEAQTLQHGQGILNLLTSSKHFHVLVAIGQFGHC